VALVVVRDLVRKERVLPEPAVAVVAAVAGSRYAAII
jgi:hypothetical protein